MLILPFPSPGDLLNPGVESGSPALKADSLPLMPPRKPSRPPPHFNKGTLFFSDLYMPKSVKFLFEKTFL